MSMDDTFDGSNDERDHGSGYHGSASRKSSHQSELSPNDQRVVDALVESRFEADSLELSGAERARAETLTKLLGLMRDYPVDDADETLIHATLARIDRHEQSQQERLVIANHADAIEADGRRGFGVPGLRKADLIAAAAAVLLIASVVLPIMQSMRQQAIDSACRNNLRNMALAFSLYAEDNHGAVPIVQAGLGGTWDQFSNAVNLKPLLEGQYCDHRHCRCPGNHDNLQMTYSYQWQRSSEPMRWDPRWLMVIMGDRNPIMDAARQGRYIDAMTLSPDHGGRGQNVLATDGATLWIDDKPIVGQYDNIWLPHGTRQLMPGAKPRDARDVFLAH